MKYSVVVPAYNSARTIEACLNGLTHQSIAKEDYEVIVVDDGSTDRTGDIVRTFPVKYVRQKNRGPAAARNYGAKEASGEILLFTDSDCAASENWVAEMVKPFTDPGVVAVKGAYRTSQRSLTARFAQLEFEERFRMLRKADSIDMVDTYSAAYRREVFWGAGGFDESFPVANAEDADLSYKLSMQGYKMAFNPDAVVCHFNHPDSIRKYARLKFGRAYWRMVIYKRYPDKMLKDSYTPQTLKLQILFLFMAGACLLQAWLVPYLKIYPFLLCAALFGLSALPLTMSAITKDLSVGVLTPFFISVRAASLGLGVLWGSLSTMIWKR